MSSMLLQCGGSSQSISQSFLPVGQQQAQHSTAAQHASHHVVNPVCDKVDAMAVHGCTEPGMSPRNSTGFTRSVTFAAGGTTLAGNRSDCSAAVEALRTWVHGWHCLHHCSSTLRGILSEYILSSYITPAMLLSHRCSAAALEVVA